MKNEELKVALKAGVKYDVIVNREPMGTGYVIQLKNTSAPLIDIQMLCTRNGAPRIFKSLASVEFTLSKYEITQFYVDLPKPEKKKA